MNIRSLVTRIRALAAKCPEQARAETLRRHVRRSRGRPRSELATAERTGDPILDVELYEPSEVAL